MSNATPDAQRDIAICIAEDRKSEEDAVKLLIMSLHDVCADLPPIVLFYPPADRKFESWCADYRRIHLVRDLLPQPFSWDVKPEAILAVLDLGFETVLWLDSDIIVGKDISPLIDRALRDSLLVTEEPSIMPHQGSELRSLAWGLAVGRSLPATVNSGVVLASRLHRALLKTWSVLMSEPIYREAQQIPFDNRPPHLKGDQDVLTALLGSEEFADVELCMLREGRDIIQSVAPASYPISDRFRHLVAGWPYFIHAMRRKPWRFNTTPSARGDLRTYYDALHCETSPYIFAARQIARRHALDLPWLERQTSAGFMLRATGLFFPSMASLTLALVDISGRKMKDLRSAQ